MMNSKFFAKNRQRLAEMCRDSLVIVPAFWPMQLTNDSAGTFLQESNFFWLTGIDEPRWIVVLDTSNGEEYLIEPEMDEITRVFDGSLDREEAIKISGIKHILSIGDYRDLLKSTKLKAYILSQDNRADFCQNPAYDNIKHDCKNASIETEKLKPVISRLRAIKQPIEINTIETAVMHTAEAFEQVRKNIDDYKYEYEIEAEFSYYFRKNNLQHAYEPIVASGANALTLHYGRNDQKIHGGVLIDIGARYHGYSADITRTYACGGQSKRWHEVHDTLRSCQLEIVDLIRPGISVREYIESSEQIMRNGLCRLGLIERDGDPYKYMPHGVSHGLGLDTHDSLGGAEVFEENMILTVEPGIYIPEESIGMRIEDDILVTSDGYKNMSAKLSTKP